MFADWLQDRGDPLGRLIVVMHAREEAELPGLADEERALFDTHLASWLGPANMPHRAGELELRARPRRPDPQARPAVAGGSAREHVDGHWLLRHLGHAIPIAINGRALRDGEAVLCHDDYIEPAPGLMFRFALVGEPHVLARSEWR